MRVTPHARQLRRLHPLSSLDLGKVSGLTAGEAERLLKSDGPNELPSAKPRSVLAVAAEVIREPMFLLLVAGGA
ncbi:MAG: cation-transporting P-type ATPase, partial [Armatimonadetes bacterium]|nr:cation-transporting P-type ATPase [Armatimonadota bacterium]